TMSRLDRFKEETKPGVSKKGAPGPASAPLPEAVEAAAPRETEKVAEPAADISFGETQTAPREIGLEPSVKHVRVRSNVDILSELDKLRKLSTQKPTGMTGMMPALSLGKKGASGISIDDLLTSRL